MDSPIHLLLPGTKSLNMPLASLLPFTMRV
jgi:hypothetical protein